MAWQNVYLGTQSGRTTAFSDLSVSGTADLNIVQAVGAVQMDSTLAVTGAATFSSTVKTDSDISGAAGSFTSINLADGAEVVPAIRFASEDSLGIYRSAASVVEVVLGQLRVPDGSEALPAIAFKSEGSLGFRRSAASTVALENGGLTIPDGNLNLGQNELVSLLTQAGSSVTAAAQQTAGELWITVGASGFSLGIESGGSLYWINSTTSG